MTWNWNDFFQIQKTFQSDGYWHQHQQLWLCWKSSWPPPWTLGGNTARAHLKGKARKNPSGDIVHFLPCIVLPRLHDRSWGPIRTASTPRLGSSMASKLSMAAWTRWSTSWQSKSNTIKTPKKYLEMIHDSTMIKWTQCHLWLNVEHESPLFTALSRIDHKTFSSSHCFFKGGRDQFVIKIIRIIARMKNVRTYVL